MRNSLTLPELPDLSRTTSQWLATATLGMGLAIGMPAAADSLAAGETPRNNPYRIDPAKQHPPAWLGENVHYRKGVGLEYRRDLKLGNTPIELGFQGPVVRKKKRVGLTVEVRF